MNNIFSISIILLLSLIISHTTQAQETSLNQAQVTNPTGTLLYTTGKNTETIGTPFYNKEWQNGHVIFNNGKRSKIVPLMYNSNTQVLFFQQGDIVNTLDANKYSGFIFNESEEEFRNGFTIDEFDVTKTDPVKIIYDGEVKLLAFYQTIKARANSKDPLTGKMIDRFLTDEAMFYLFPDGTVKKTKIKKKNMINDLGSFKKELNDFTKKTNNKVKTESDAIELLKHYDSLVQKN